MLTTSSVSITVCSETVCSLFVSMYLKCSMFCKCLGGQTKGLQAGSYAV